MKKKLIFPLIIMTLFMGGCSLISSNKISQEDYDAIVEECDELEDEVKDLKSQVRTLKKENSALKKESEAAAETEKANNFKAPSVSDEEMAQIVEKITYEAAEASDELIVTLLNNSDTTIPELSVDITYYDASDKILSTDYGYIETFGGNRGAVITFEYPTDSSYNLVEYARYELALTGSAYDYGIIDQYDNISFESNVASDNGIMVNVTNNGDKEVSMVEVAVVYYKNEKIIGCSFNWDYYVASGSSTVLDFDVPYDANYEDLEYDNYVVSINQAYSY